MDTVKVNLKSRKFWIIFSFVSATGFFLAGIGNKQPFQDIAFFSGFVCLGFGMGAIVSLSNFLDSLE